jgi:diaminohydroxyphosphoribosylaminopyrimidine deaminase/5-amino-6-(5-phosphoribosylamino)uracil reductase
VAFVTLEPCGARSSGQASCAERLARAGVARVVVACEDASKFAAGQGEARLREAGVPMEAGLLAEEARPLYAGYRPAI